MQLGAAARWAAQVCRQKNYRNALLSSRRFSVSTTSSQSHIPNEVLARTKNIGIIAHIDAGKTTTTERMLYYSGYTRRIGDVDDGSTVTDFLPAERARGITIQSAAITFHWPPLANNSDTKASAPPDAHTINLIDTPGHADFTFEVLRSLRILDGAVCILDGVAGVEAQTEKVWHQAQKYSIPKIIFVNKLDRDGAAFGMTVKEIAAKLHAWPAVCQIPWFENGNERFQGLVDVINLRALRWPQGGDGKSIESHNISELEAIEPRLAGEAIKARHALIELLSEHDDILVERYLEVEDDSMAIEASDIMASLRRVLLSKGSTVVPVFLGASFRNIGVQPLLDNVTALLPTPIETSDPEFEAGPLKGGLQELMSGKLGLSSSPDQKKKAISKKPVGALVKNLEACALAFKVVHDAKRGVLVYVRVYQGSLNKNASIYNTTLQITERMPRLLKMYASDAIEIDSIPAGQIGVIPGLKHARTGDTLITYTGSNPKTGPPAPLNNLQLRPIEVPPPVFFASIEPHSVSDEKSVMDALAMLLREDPSLQLSTDEDSGQTLLSGMGELHLEIARDRLIQDLKAKATMGSIEIGYREYISVATGPEFVLYDRETAGKSGKAGCTANVAPFNEVVEEPDDVDHNQTSLTSKIERDGNIISSSIMVSSESTTDEPPLPAQLTTSIIHTALQNGALAAIARGPKYTFPVRAAQISLQIDLEADIFGSSTTPGSISAAARLATAAALRKSAVKQAGGLMEPVMNVILTVDDASLGTVVHDLTSARGAHIVSLDDADATSPDNNLEHAREEIRLIDTTKVYAPSDPFESSNLDGSDQLNMQSGNRPRTITARVPLREMVGYLKVLRSHTGGRGTFIMSVDRFERMGSQREKVVLKELRGV